MKHNLDRITERVTVYNLNTVTTPTIGRNEIRRTHKWQKSGC